MWARIHGKSMVPFLWPAAAVFIRPCAEADLRCGHIVVCKREGGFVAHRLMQKVWRDDRLYVRLKGDAALTADHLVCADDIAGVVSIGCCGRRMLRMDTACARLAGLCLAVTIPFVVIIQQRLKSFLIKACAIR
jgi:hypothetical protein